VHGDLVRLRQTVLRRRVVQAFGRTVLRHHRAQLQVNGALLHELHEPGAVLQNTEEVLSEHRDDLPLAGMST
jgi:hypothetical protein